MSETTDRAESLFAGMDPEAVQAIEAIFDDRMDLLRLMDRAAIFVAIMSNDRTHTAVALLTYAACAMRTMGLDLQKWTVLGLLAWEVSDAIVTAAIDGKTKGGN